MPEGPGVFSFGQIVVSAVIGAVVSFVLVWLYGRWSKETPLAIGESVVVAVLAGVSILIWRLAGNTQPLNDDPIPLISPNDVLCPIVTYVILGLYAEVSQATVRPGWGRLRAILTIASLIINVVTI